MAMDSFALGFVLGADDLGLSALGTVITVSVVAVALGAFKVIAHLARRGKAPVDSWTAVDREKLNNVARIVSRCDSEGVPMSYVPRRLLKLGDQQLELMRIMVGLVERQTALSTTLHETLSAHMGREENELKAIRAALDKFVA